MENALKRVKNGRLLLIPASDETRGHGTTGNARFYKQQLEEWLRDRAAAGDVRNACSVVVERRRIGFAERLRTCR